MQWKFINCYWGKGNVGKENPSKEVETNQSSLLLLTIYEILLSVMALSSQFALQVELSPQIFFREMELNQDLLADKEWKICSGKPNGNIYRNSLERKKKKSTKKKYTGKEHVNCHFFLMKVEAKFQLPSYGWSLKQNKNRKN